MDNFQIKFLFKFNVPYKREREKASIDKLIAINNTIKICIESPKLFYALYL